jgi:hypothetical protein
MSKKSKPIGIRFLIALGLALILDFGSFIIGWIPFIGQFYALFGVGILFILIGPMALIALMEFVPVLNLVPSFTLAVILSKTSFAQNMFPWMQKKEDV